MRLQGHTALKRKATHLRGFFYAHSSFPRRREPRDAQTVVEHPLDSRLRGNDIPDISFGNK
jgi:hypothetical protein